MVKKVVIATLATVWCATLLALIWMSEVAKAASIGPQIIAVAILVSVGWALWKLSSFIPSPLKDNPIQDQEVPEKLTDPLPAVLIKTIDQGATVASPKGSVLSWIGGQPPGLHQAWPCDPITEEKMQHYATLSFSQLNQHLPPDILPESGQILFFVCRKDALLARARGITSSDFAIIERSDEQVATKPERKGDFPFAPIDFTSEQQNTDVRMGSSKAHQVFGVGLDIQNQLEPVQDRQMLLQLGYDDAIGVEGLIQFMIYPKDLQARDWKKIIAVTAND